MESITEAKKLIAESKNICIIPSQYNEPESLAGCLALFYTLKELNKNVNLIIEDFPEKFNFLIPSLDFITSPKNFVISIPQNTANVSQIYYEKNQDSLKIYLTVDRGRIKKDNVSFYFSDAKPDLVITLGISDIHKQLLCKLDSFGFILDAPILNIDNSLENRKFGGVNLIGDKSLSEIILEVVKYIEENLVKKSNANCLLTGLIIYYENFKNSKTNSQIFQISAELIKKGAEYQQIIDNLYQTTEKEINFLSEILQNIKIDNDFGVYSATIDSDNFENFTETQAGNAIEKIKTIGVQNDLLVLWKSHASEPQIKGFFYSKKPNLVSKIAESQQTIPKKDWLFLSMSDLDINSAKDKIIKSITNK